MSQNNKIVVVYKSKSGFTKTYATWLAEELKGDLKEAKNVKAEEFKSYDTIIYGGGMYAKSINGAKLITKNYEQLKDKKLILFAVGSTPVREETNMFIKEANIPANQIDHINFFYLRGGFDYHKLTLIDKILMSMLKVKLKNVKNPDADQKGLLAAYHQPLDFTKRKNIQPIIDCVGNHTS